MFRLAKNTLCTVVVSATLLSFAGPASAGEKFGFGQTATAEQISGWDIDIRPDGKGLPAGQGSVEEGEALYEQLCASCHGLFGEGEGRWPVLAGGEGTLTEDRPVKTVGSYWPYASTLYDYIRRAMPFTAPRSLSNEQTYQLVAYVLYLNELIEEDFVISQDNLASIEMPNQEGFFVDPRPDVKNTRCMKDCADISTMQIVGTLQGITPVSHFVEGADAPAASHHAQEEKERQLQGETGAADGHVVTLTESAVAGRDTYSNACQACHSSGIAGSPKFGDKNAWSVRIGQGMSVLISHAINGFSGESGTMPPKGGRSDLSDKQVEQAVAYMVESSQ
ncbi:c-type cytochrome [Amphritea sp. HPY]|uniref:c-type cytochrome n=1 Tax=Amphritea sp. HPY TaxID=3421652 RepID=UPI003D7E8DDB